MKNIGVKAGVGGVIGISGLALCCALPGLGIVTAAGLGAGLGLWTESVLGGILVAALVWIGIVAYKRIMARRRLSAKNEGAVIACDPTVFSKDERVEHAALAEKVLLRWPHAREETPQGYTFHYRANAPFNDIARWVADEQRCCPWGTYTLELSPSAESAEAEIRLHWNGGENGKPFLTDALNELEKSGGKGFESFLNAQGKITRFRTAEKSGCGC